MTMQRSIFARFLELRGGWSGLTTTSLKAVLTSIPVAGKIIEGILYSPPGMPKSTVADNLIAEYVKDVMLAEKARALRPPGWSSQSGLFRDYSFTKWWLSPEVTLGLGYLRIGNVEKAIEFLEVPVKLVADSTLLQVTGSRQQLSFIRGKLEEARGKLQKVGK